MKLKKGKAAVYLFTGAGLVSVALLFLFLAGGLLFSAKSAGISAALSAFSTEWAPDAGKYGILPMIVATLAIAFLATLIAAPLSFGIISYIWIYNNPAGRFLRWLIRFMSGIPTVVYGFCGLFIMVPLMRTAFGGSGYNILVVALVLSLLILPTMTTAADSALHPILEKPESLTLSAAAVGLSRARAFFYIALKIRWKWIVTGVLLSFARALGDTITALMLSGNAPIMPSGILSTARTLSAHISLLNAVVITPQIEFILFLSGCLLFASALSVSVFTRSLRKR